MTRRARSLRIAGIVYVLSTSLLVVILDRLTKYIFCRCLSEGESVKIVPGAFHLTLVLNSGAAFGLFQGRSIIFMIASALIIILICVYVWLNKCKDLPVLTALGLILGGASGNLVDRAAFGYVIDFLDFRFWPVFNIADSAITAGAALLTIVILRPRRGRRI